ncbi:GBS Bsp-like repeat-containing protein, partial [Pseudomonas aeruginosa]|uniref:GBS Bsp-like repeat-containing protein n=1 Tax=Pseudomonas aeruginosa TaxID=287 RepID=UPI0039791F9B
GYTVTCTVTDNVGVTRVAFPSWTHFNGQDDLFWRDGTKSGNTYSFRVNKSEHNGESEWYSTHIYAYDAA